MKVPGVLRFWIAFGWLFGSACVAAIEVATHQHFMVVAITLLAGGVGAAMLAEWWSRYYD